jgi:hypothetical protein
MSSTPEALPLRLTAYFDESTDSMQSRIFAVAGWTGWECDWRRIEPLWNETLAAAAIRVFHMKDCESHWGEFRGWSPTQKIQLVSDLITLIENTGMPPRGLVGFWSGLNLRDYDELVRGKPLPWEDDPYFLCFLHCLRQILPFTDGLPKEVQIDFVFDRNEKLRKRLLAAYEQAHSLPDLEPYRGRFGKARFSSRADSIGLQAADMLVYECYKHQENVASGFIRPQRKSLDRLKARVCPSQQLPRELLERVGKELEQLQAVREILGVKPRPFTDLLDRDLDRKQ